MHIASALAAFFFILLAGCQSPAPVAQPEPQRAPEPEAAPPPPVPVAPLPPPAPTPGERALADGVALRRETAIPCIVELGVASPYAGRAELPSRLIA